MPVLKVQNITFLITCSERKAIFLLRFLITFSRPFTTSVIFEIREIIFSEKLRIKKQDKKEIKKKKKTNKNSGPFYS